jgi:predicted amidohydrolase YtcJ
MAIKDGKILAVNSDEEILERYTSKEKKDAEGNSIFPGFIDAHCHFYGYGKGLNEVDLVGTKSLAEVIEKTTAFAKEHDLSKEISKTDSSARAEQWIIGRGWDQNDWDVKEFPDRKKLDSLFPDRPVFLKRIDGHAALANKKALQLAGINDQTKISGGEIQNSRGRDASWTVLPKISACGNNCRYWEPTGILVDNAVDLVETKIPQASKEQIARALLNAQKNCLAVGLTTIDDAGLEKKVIDVIDELQKKNELKMRVYAMLTPTRENLDHYIKTGPYKTDKLNVRSFKFYGDGALGSRGACLLTDYSDKAGWNGFMLNTIDYFRKMADTMYMSGFQMNTHCIGDSAVRAILEIYEGKAAEKESMLKTMSLLKPAIEKSGLKFIDSLDMRWRIEHTQIISKEDLKQYGKYFVPSVQPTHATSDMYWADKRLGKERVKTAYAFKDLLKAHGWIALGTDFPVEDISPFKTFYAAVYRKDANRVPPSASAVAQGFPTRGYQMENALTREETLKGMTIWAAYSNFEEKEKGSLTKGKWADFVILDTDLMNCAEDKILNTKVISTYIAGEQVYKK